MKAISPMLKTLVAVVVLVAGSVMLPAQTIQYLNSNNIVAGIGIGGNLFSVGSSFAPGASDLFITKFDSGRAEIFTSTLWMNGVDEGGNAHGAIGAYRDSGFIDGPIAQIYNSAYYHYYNRVFKVTQTQIAIFRSLSFPTTVNLVDSSILYWPGKGNPSVLNDYSVSIDSFLAPFIDVNGNGIYDPLQGDYPAFLGDQAIFFVFNDVNGTRNVVNCLSMGIEIRGLATCFNDTSPGNIPYNKRALNNSIFVQYEIENKSQHTYADFDIAQWLDPDIGCFQDDYVGCDSARNLMFAYNGSANDKDCYPELGFGTLPVALGVQLLSEPMNVFGYFSGDGGAPFNTIPIGDDSLCSTFLGYSEGYWSDTIPFTYGGIGYNPEGNRTKFLFSGDPTDSSQWSEVSNHDLAGDRRMFGATDSLHLTPGQTINFTVAFTTSFDSTSNHISIVDTLKIDADSIRAFYLHHILPGQQTLGVKELPNANLFTVHIYPNPTNNNVTIESSDVIQTIQLMDIEGRVILHKTIGATKMVLPVNALAKGVYLLNVQGVDVSVVRKLVIQ